MKHGKKILVVEDSSEDFMIIQRAFTKSDSKITLLHKEDGSQAIDYLEDMSKKVAMQHAPEVDLILLDLNLPVASGKEVLSMIRQCKPIEKMPVLVFSTSDNPTDIEDCYQLGANAYLQKPSRLEEFDTLIRAIEKFWFHGKCLMSS